ncbi:MAG: ImmA/IrrE family metallo-endopeptidase [Planctomycetaceae bacterium]|jgi:Zn-dependent peptidase ImmA (M78 family)|nr:ImmA/IrrE family metallo-endopeptidase [Planctomycetaceae bacterium]
MVTDLSNIDVFFNDLHQPQRPESIETCVERIRSAARDANITTEPLDIRAVVAELFKLKIEEADLGRDVCGFLEKAGCDWQMYINIRASDGRKRFVIARELGHFVFYRDKYIADASLKPTSLVFRYDETDPIERQATDFALALMLPKNVFMAYIERSCITIEKLSYIFGVSTSVVTCRAAKLGCLLFLN